MDIEKPCIRCGIVKKLDCFHKRSSMLDGYYNTCKICRKLDSVNYYLNYKEDINRKGRIYNSEHREEKAITDKQYYMNNSAKLLSNNKQYRAENKDVIKKQRQGYYNKNKEKISKYKKEYYKTPQGKMSNNRGKRKWKALKLSQLHPLHNSKIENQLELIRQRVEKCLGVEHHLDHVWPLSKGGLHHIENLRVVPSSINLRKNNSMTFKHPGLTMWYDLPDWLIEDTLNWKKS